ncbi:MAG TPA: uracil-DNA glycosylase [Thermoanaerobaculia bacterium]|nr:uracil-DNA glycosylase [Thermoanaerobaculia bacterium]
MSDTGRARDAGSIRDALEYFADLGFEDLLVRPRDAAGAPESAVPEAEDAEREAAPVGRAPDDSEQGDAEDRRARLEAVRDEALVCTACALAPTRTKVVFGSGTANADLMFIGEGPGYHEDQQGLPFVGAAGELLTRIIAAIGLEREQVYIANVVKCRPPNNRDPKPEEVAACIGFLRQQIRLVRPSVIVALGRVAAQTLLASTAPIGRLRGRWHELEGVPLRVTYHPAALLRDPSLKRPTWEDMQVVRDHLGA